MGKIYYKKSVYKDLRNIDKKHQGRILSFVESKFTDDSIEFVKLKGELEGLFRTKIGEYRIVFTRYKDGYLILRISHRKEAYR